MVTEEFAKEKKKRRRKKRRRERKKEKQNEVGGGGGGWKKQNKKTIRRNWAINSALIVCPLYACSFNDPHSFQLFNHFNGF